MADYYLGIDTGGTKSHSLITDSSGAVCGFGLGGPGNHEIVGYEGVQAVLHHVLDQALEMAGIPKNQILGAGFGIAGFDWPSEKAPTMEVIHTLGLNEAKMEAVNDSLIGVLAGTTEGWGIAVDAGTGNNCWGRDRSGRTGQVTGCGTWMAEEGGASELVHNVVRAISRDWSMRGPHTRLTDAFIQRVGAVDSTDLLEGLLQGRYHVGASAAPLVFKAAREGDEVATDLIHHTGRALGDLVVGVARQLDLLDQEFEVVQIGSLFEGGPMLSDPMKEFVWQYASRTKFTRLSAPPVAGAVLLGMEQVGIDIKSIREALVGSAMKIKEKL